MATRNATLPNRGITVTPLSAHAGAEVSGLDLNAPMGEDRAAELRTLLAERGVLFFRGQDVTPRGQYDFAAGFGRPDPGDYTGSFPAVDGIDAIRELRKEPDQTRNVGGVWHTDRPYIATPPAASVLVAREVPEAGGDTLFTHMGAAYDALSPGLQATLEGLSAVHARMNAYAPETGRPLQPDRYEAIRARNDGKEASHPVIGRHPESGRKFLYVSLNYTVRFDGWTRDESLPLLRYLNGVATRPEHQCRFRWRAGDLAIWDNRAVMHLALNDYQGQRRVMHRTTVEGPFLNAM